MAKEYRLGHNVVQTACYEVTREEYRQTECDKVESEKFDPPEWKNHLTTG